MGIQFTPDMISSILGYVRDIFLDIKLPVLLICGVALGFFIIDGILKAIRGTEEERHPFTSPTSSLYGTHLSEIEFWDMIYEDEYED